MLLELKTIFEHHVILSIGVLLFFGYFSGILFQKIKLPAITGYILAGLIFSKSVTGIIHTQVLPHMTGITEFALSIIAVSIGGEFAWAKMKKTGVKIFIITIMQSLFAFTIATSVLTLLGLDFRYALLLGAIATATAPAATVIIIKQLKLRGKFIDYLYGVVALDDAVCVILFGVIFAAVAPLLTGVAVSGGILGSMLHAVLELFFSILMGVIAGLLLHSFTIKKRSNNEIMIISIAIILIITSLSLILHLSPLIANMFLGATLINLSHKNHRIFNLLEPITPPLFALFFILAGTELDISVLFGSTILLFGVAFVLARATGKYLGTSLGCKLAKADNKIRKNLGLCLMPQAGVAIGLAIFIQTSPLIKSAPPNVQEKVILLVNIVLFSVFVNELVGPILAKRGIIKGTKID